MDFHGFSPGFQNGISRCAGILQELWEKDPWAYSQLEKWEKLGKNPILCPIYALEFLWEKEGIKFGKSPESIGI